MRKSIEVEGFSHSGQPIPAASRVGNVIMTGGVYGMDPLTGTVPDDIAEQARLMFQQLDRILVAAGSGFSDVIKMTVYTKTRDVRDILNEHWIAAFPDANSRPARHTVIYDHLPKNLLIQCDALAVVD
jgi:enamine deaminase RidA (YjgF/YER057c/UK114 family)